MSLKTSVNNFFKAYIALGHIKSEDKDEEIRMATLWMTAGPFSVIGVAWGVGYFLNDLFYPGLIPFCYGLASAGSSVLFRYRHNFKFYLKSQLFLILILPFSLQLSLGGFEPSSAVIMWASISPMAATFFLGTRKSLKWFIAFLVLLCTAWALDGVLVENIHRDLSDQFIRNVYLLNFIGVFAMLFGILYYFIDSQELLKKSIAQKNRDLIEQSEKLKELDEIKSTFFANISHEFRTPLTIILGMVEKQIKNPAEPPNAKHTATMQRNAKRLLQLINQLLDLSKLESGQLKLSASEQDIVLFTKNTSAQFESLAGAKNIPIIFNGKSIADENSFEPIDLFFDPEKIQKVISNLMSNAVKFTPRDGSIEVEVEKTEGESSMGVVRIQVINSGSEIPADKLPHLFDRFFQADSASNRKYEGTGIGLALVKELTELHRGSVAVTSRMNKTTFSVALPINTHFLTSEEKVDAVPIERAIDLGSALLVPETETTLEEPTAEPVDQLEVLVVEDNADLREFIKGILEVNYHITEAVDGVDGFEKALEIIPDLIVSDVMMPRMDGYELCGNLKSNETTNHIPVILLTAKASKENKLEGLETGADDYLTKPFDERELGVRIKNLIEIRKNLQAKFQGEINLKPNTVKVASIHEQFLEKFKAVIEKQIDNADFSVEDLASELGMSRSQIHRKLKALTDQSATAFIRNYRLHRAADLLRQNAGNVTEIAYEVGFNSQTYFSSSFQELFGVSPSEYKDHPEI